MKTTPGASARVGDADIYARIDEAVTDAAADLVRWRRHLHEHPELSNRESQTAAYLIDQLRKIGVDDIRSGLAGHGIVAIIRGGAVPRVDRRIALRADMDALPIEESTELPYASRVEARVLGLPWNLNPVCVIPIGWAKGKYGPTTRAAIEDVVHVDRYGNQPPRPAV